MIRLFLSASIPLPGRNPKYLATADVIAIRESIKALVGTVLDQSTITFGGHPAITPLIARLLKDMPSETRKRVILYQSTFFKQDFIKENDEFIELRLINEISEDREGSLLLLRNEMIESEKFDAAIFIGGMEGVLDEFRLFRKIHPNAICYPIGSTGAAALELFNEVEIYQKYLINELTYPVLFRKIINDIKYRKR